MNQEQSHRCEIFGKFVTPVASCGISCAPCIVVTAGVGEVAAKSPVSHHSCCKTTPLAPRQTPLSFLIPQLPWTIFSTNILYDCVLWFYAPALGRHSGTGRSVRLSVPWRGCLGYRHAGGLQLSHRRPPEMCGLWTRPRTDVDPPLFLPPSNCHRRGAYRLAARGAIPCYCIVYIRWCDVT